MVRKRKLCYDVKSIKFVNLLMLAVLSVETQIITDLRELKAEPAADFQARYSPPVYHERPAVYPHTQITRIKRFWTLKNDLS